MLVRSDALNARVVSFWTLSIQCSRIDREQTAAGSSERLRIDRSIAAHSELRQNLIDGGIEYWRLELLR